MGIIHEPATTDDLRRLCVRINALHADATSDDERDWLFRCWEWVQDKARNIDDAWSEYRVNRHELLVKNGVRPIGSHYDDYLDDDEIDSRIYNYKGDK